MASCQIEVEQNNLAALFGQLDHNMQLVSRELQVVITQRDGGIHISGSGNNVLLAQKVVENLLLILQKNGLLDEQSIQYCLDLALAGSKEMPPILEDDVICLTTKGRPVKAKTLGQKKYIQAIRDNSVVFGIGPAGTGKTYLAVAMAVRAFKAGEVEKIILTRPAVEAGEKLGFLPGDLQNKVDPYLRPLYDALYDMLGAESFLRYQERGSIEVAPLAYMRGRTLNDSFIILDEAQNTTAEQMKMFLTRLGFGSKAVITGDVTQIDLPETKKSGLIVSAKIVRGIEGIEEIRLNDGDVVRHRLVREIVKAYDNYYKRRGENTK